MGHHTSGLFLSRSVNACGTLSIIENTGKSHISYNRRIVLRHKVFHKSLLNVDACTHFFVTNMFEAAKRVTAPRIKTKKALSLEELNKIFVKLNQNKTKLADQRLLTIFLIAFCGFMRFSEVSRLRRSDFIFSSTYVKVIFEKSKADIYRVGMWVYISVSNKNLLNK